MVSGDTSRSRTALITSGRAATVAVMTGPRRHRGGRRVGVRLSRRLLPRDVPADPILTGSNRAHRTVPDRVRAPHWIGAILTARWEFAVRHRRSAPAARS